MTTQPQEKPARPKWDWVYYVILILLLVVGAAYRLVGLDWDADQNLHPDERFLTGVETALIPVDSFSEYFDTENSTLNPHNQGHTFFVYGTLPIFTVRYVGEWLDKSSWGDINLVGRQLSAFTDLFVILLVFLAGARLYGKRVGIIAAAFTTFTVMQIQLSHFFAVDTFLNLFTFLSIYLGILVATGENKPDVPPFKLSTFIWFGVALGAAVASKVTTLPVAVVLPLAYLIRLSRLEQEKRYDAVWTGFTYMVAAGLVSLFTFRIFQPYAFSGPGFFGLKPNEKWLENLNSLRAQQVGDVDWPPSIQWARRSFWFSFNNLVTWGMGLPMGIMAWAGFLFAGWKMLKGEGQKHFLLWFWVAAYFLWQSSAFNPTMRYQLPIYPALAVFAGWAVVRFWDHAKDRISQGLRWGKALRVTAAVVGVLSVGLTVLWATAFIQIYTRPVTRVAASDWIYQNLPGPLTLHIDTEEGTFNQPLPFPYNFVVNASAPYWAAFNPKQSGMLSEVFLKYVLVPEERRTLSVFIAEADNPDEALMVLSQEAYFSGDQAGMIQGFTLTSNPPVVLTPDKDYILRFNLLIGQGEAELREINMRVTLPTGEDVRALIDLPVTVSAETPYEYMFRPEEIMTIMEVYATMMVKPEPYPTQQTLRLEVSTSQEFLDILAQAEVEVDLSTGVGEGYLFEFDKTVEVLEGTLYYLRLSDQTEGGVVTFLGTAIAVEAPWDDGLPLRTGGYDGYGGIYQRDLNFDMYADNDVYKLDRWLELLETSEYFTISSSRQWASTSRIPERYPLNIAFYRHILGCPEDKTIEWCYNVAMPGMFEGDLGFDLVAVYQSDPNLGSFKINDQFSEEAFTVYDHPKVLIFAKRADYDHQNTIALLSSVDLYNVIRLTPKKAADYTSLLLPEDRLEEQQAGGTWADLFNVGSLINRSQFLAVLVWYLMLLILGLVTYPLVRLALPGLPDKGYPLARAAGMLLLAYLSWLAGSVGLTYTRPVIWIIFFLILAAGLWQGYRQREALKEEWRENWKYFFKVEGLFLVFFLLVLFVRWGNPDLWHPYKGGEKPMDFSYFNAVLKSTSFPAYDPWYAGGYINYYYFGFVYVATPVKMLGIVPAVAYNLIIPTLFAFLAMGAFSIGWNLIRAWQDKQGEDDGPSTLSPWYVGLSAALGTAVLGNLDTVRMIFQGWQKISAGNDYDMHAAFFTRLSWLWDGFIKSFLGDTMPYGFGEWYWNPSRVIHVETDVPITEFPWFTTIYADLHAHMIALPLTVLALGWILSVVLSKAWSEKPGRWQVAWSFIFGGLAIGVLRPTNTWDLPTYLALGCVVLFYAVYIYYQPPDSPIKKQVGEKGAKILAAVGAVGILGVLTFLLYKPYGDWYAQPYSEIQRWWGTHTGTGDYLIHWGLFLFVLVSWMAWETRQWMAGTPLSHLRKLEPYKAWIVISVVVFFLLYAALFILEINIHWLALPLAAWAAILIFRPEISDAKRFVLFLVGTGLFLTIMVEVIVLTGDIGRMNTVFKFYLQAWVLLAVSSAAALGWLWKAVRQWSFGKWTLWIMAFMLLVSSTAFYPLLATTEKIRDRMSQESPPTLDGMEFMNQSVYYDQGSIFDLSQDYRAIRWLQENVQGSPVIVEGNTPIYRWGSRMTIYTGLPGVLGWDWHQTQQRGFVETSRLPTRNAEILFFYTTTDKASAVSFLDKYNVSYIILGQLERTYYPGEGLNKFELFDGELWKEVFRDGDTVIYEVIQ